MIKKLLLAALILAKASAANACVLENSNYKFGTVLDDVSVEFGESVKFNYWPRKAKPGLRYKIIFDSDFSDSVVEKVKTKLNASFFNFFDFGGPEALDKNNIQDIEDGDIFLIQDLNLQIGQGKTTFLKEEEQTGIVTYVLASAILIKPLNLSEDELVSIIIHEILHAICVGHSLGGGQWWINNREWVSYSYSPKQKTPIMHPAIIAKDITDDDIHAFKLAIGIKEKNTISGKAFHEGSPVSGVNIVAINAKTNQRFFAVLDRFGKGTGEFLFENLPDGDYHFRFEPNVRFGFGSSASRTGVLTKVNFYSKPMFLTRKGFKARKGKPFSLKNNEILDFGSVNAQ